MVNRWRDVLIALLIGLFAGCVLHLVALFWPWAASIIHMDSTELVLSGILALLAYLVLREHQ